MPNGPKLFGTLDETLSHKCRYTEASLTELGRDCGLVVSKVVPFNRSGLIAWWLNGGLLKRTYFGRFQVAVAQLADATVSPDRSLLAAAAAEPDCAVGSSGNRFPRHQINVDFRQSGRRRSSPPVQAGRGNAGRRKSA